jgi:hypothetical protein
MNMEDFSVTMRLTGKEYAKVLYTGLYRKPGFIIITILGVYYMVTALLDQLEIINFYSGIPYPEFFVGLFALLFPSLLVMASLRQLRSSPSFQHEMVFTFGENGMKVQGLNFKGEFQWAHLTKRKEFGKFLILYHSKKMGNFLDKTKLTGDQLEFIRSKVRSK